MTLIATSITKSRLVAALICFTVVNVVFFSCCQLIGFDRFEVAHHGWTWWAIKDYKFRKKAPDVMLIGSSLLVHVIISDAEFLQKPLKYLTHNRLCHLEHLLSRRIGIPITTSAIGIGGMHASDACVITTGLVPTKKPAAIVYMIAPRDLMDNTLHDPLSTDTFELMSRISNTQDAEAAVKTSGPDKLLNAFKKLVSNVVPIYDNRHELRSLAERSILAVYTYSKIPGKIHANSVGIIKEPFDQEPITLVPGDPLLEAKKDNWRCYACAYRPFSPTIYKQQLIFLSRMLDFAKKNSITMVLVNMPLRRDNLRAMEPNFHELYMRDIGTLAKRFGANFIDMHDTSNFTDDSFSDSAHLNSGGSAKFINQLSERIAPYLSRALARDRYTRDPVSLTMR